MRREGRRRTSLGSKVQNQDFWDSPFCFLHPSFATYVDNPRRSLCDLSHLLFPNVKLRRERGLQWKVNQFCSATSQTNLSHPIPGRKHKAPLLRKKQTPAKQPFRASRKQRKAKTFRIPLPPPAAKGRREGRKQGRHKVSISPRLLLAKAAAAASAAAAAAAAAASFGNRRRRLLPNSQEGQRKELLLLLDDTVLTCALQVESPPTSPGRAPFVLGGGRPPPLFPRLAGGERRGGGHFFTLLAKAGKRGGDSGVASTLQEGEEKRLHFETIAAD